MRSNRLVRSAALTSSLALAAATMAAAAAVPATATASPGAEECQDDSSSARVREGATAKEPKLYPDNEAKQYGLIPDLPTLADGSVRVRTVFHVITDSSATEADRTRLAGMVQEQMRVLNEAYSGASAPGRAADTPFRFDLAADDLNFVTSDAWANVTTGKSERDMKAALHEGDSETLNVYVADIGGGLLGWAYFPKDYNNGRGYIDGVVILDESMPGGVNPDTGLPWKYGLGDTLTHEVGHWLMLEHTFAHGCSASGDGVADTPKEAYPQFNCPEGADSCAAPGLDPIHNFMDYTQDSCMDMFTEGQSDRMSDAWRAFREGGNG